MRLRLAGMALAAVALMGRAPARCDDSLVRGFRNPPAAAKPHTWWHWINGNSSKEGITADLEAMKRVGIGGAQIFNVDCGLPSGPVPFMTPRWRELILHAATEAKRLGIELCIHNCAGWSSSGGPWITPEFAMQRVSISETRVAGGGLFVGHLPQPATNHSFYRDIAVIAVRTPDAETAGASPLRIKDLNVKACYERGGRVSQDRSATPPGAAIPQDGVIDLTPAPGAGGRVDAGGEIRWDAPTGSWTILRIGHTPTGAMNAPSPDAGRGLECDKLSREAMDAHWAGMMATVIKQIGPLAGAVLNNALIDSYEVGSQNWTPRMREEFRKRRGYDLLPWLPVLSGRVIGSVGMSERFLWDFRRVICDLFAENYFGRFQELCHQNGMVASNEPYGNGPFDNLQAGGRADIPMGEFWVGGGTLETAKLAASASHTYGRRLTGAESFTADDRHGKWMVDPYAIKALGDLVFTLGVNRYIFHRYAAQPWIGLNPGLTMGPWGTSFDRTNTWWEPGAAWMKYVARCQYLLQSGRFVADALVYYGEDAPNDLPARYAIRPEIPEGYDYDGCSAETLLGKVTVRAGRIVLPDGMSYRVLVLPESDTMTEAVALRVRELVRAGATVVGPRPDRSPGLVDYPKCDSAVAALGAEVWGAADGKTVMMNRCGKGRVYWGVPLARVFAEAKLGPDFSFKARARDARLVYIHRTIGDADVYFVSNQRSRPEVVDCTFRVSGAPQVWLPDTGTTAPATVWNGSDTATTVRLRFDPAGSAFIVFPKGDVTAASMASVERLGPAPAHSSGPTIRVTLARYESADGRGADVTDKVQEMVANGQFSIPATNESFGDPVSLVVKQLRLEYTVNGKALKQTVAENETAELAPDTRSVALPEYELRADVGGVDLIAWQPGAYSFRTAAGQKGVVHAPAPLQATARGPWKLSFPAGAGAPESVQLPELISWPDHAETGVRYFSGTATYSGTISVPTAAAVRGRRVVLDLGRVKNLAEVTLNGKALGVLWKPPFCVDVTGIVRPGANSLTVRVTNLWPNRLIGDEQYPAEVEWSGGPIRVWPEWLWSGKPRPATERIAFTTWKFFDKDSPLLESGMMGPVTIRSAAPVRLQVR